MLQIFKSKGQPGRQNTEKWFYLWYNQKPKPTCGLFPNVYNCRMDRCFYTCKLQIGDSQLIGILQAIQRLKTICLLPDEQSYPFGLWSKGLNCRTGWRLFVQFSEELFFTRWNDWSWSWILVVFRRRRIDINPSLPLCSNEGERGRGGQYFNFKLPDYDPPRISGCSFASKSILKLLH